MLVLDVSIVSELEQRENSVVKAGMSRQSWNKQTTIFLPNIHSGLSF